MNALQFDPIGATTVVLPATPAAGAFAIPKLTNGKNPIYVYIAVGRDSGAGTQGAYFLLGDPADPQIPTITAANGIFLSTEQPIVVHVGGVVGDAIQHLGSVGNEIFCVAPLANQ